MMLTSNDLITNNKVDALAEQLRRIAVERGPDAQMPTAREIRETLGVGMSTVQSALAALEEQSVIYRKHGVGIFVSPQLHRKTILVLLDDSFFRTPGLSPFWGILWGLLVHEAEERAESNNERCVFNLMAGSEAHDLPEMVRRAVESGQVHGVISIGLDMPIVRYFQKYKIPVVSFASPSPAMVETNGIEIIQEGVKALAERGCSRIGLWRPVQAFPSTTAEFIIHPEEIGAFTEALHKNGLPLIPRLLRQALHLLESTGIRSEGRTTITQQEQGFLLAMEEFGDPDPERPRPDGIVITDDMMTWGVITALNRLGLRVGKDIQIATHSNKGSNVLFGYEQDLVRLEVDPYEIVQRLFSLLHLSLRGETVPATTPCGVRQIG